MIYENDYPAPWPLWQKVLFRFFFIYLLLHVFSRPFFDGLPVFKLIGDVQDYICFVGVNLFNTYVLHFKDKLMPVERSSDALYNWAQLILFFTLAVAGTIVWSIADRKRKSYYRASYYSMAVLRYFLAYISLMYGIIKMYGLQMPFPTLTNLATPLGDYSPMKFSWLFVGYDTKYQIFSGILEFMVGAMLLYRRTVTLGLFIGLGVYINVLMLNLSFDIPAKIFSVHVVLMLLYLLMRDVKRLANFFVLNKPATQNILYHFVPSKTGNVIRIVLKCIFLLSVMYLIAGPFNSRKRYLETEKKEIKPIPFGLYNVTTFVKNGDTLPVLANDTLIWKDIIFERGNKYASVNSADTIFKNLYNRGVFYYKADTLKNTMSCFKTTEKGRKVIFNLKYKLSGNKRHVQMWVQLKKDSLYIELDKSNRKFILGEKPFHWITDVNRYNKAHYK